MESEYQSPNIPVRMLNQYAYCPRLAYLEWVQGEWRENLDTIQGTIVHHRVDVPSGDLDKEVDDYRTLEQARSVSMSSDTLSITGKMDLVEKDNRGVIPIEYKKAKLPAKGPHLPDQIQVAAQALILRDNGYRVSHGAIYYAQSKRRVDIDLDQVLIDQTIQTIGDLRRVSESDTPPPVLIDSPKCPRCSLVSICLPDETHMLQLSDADASLVKPRRLVASIDVGVPVYLTHPGTWVGKSGERLVVKEDNQVVQEIRIRDIDHVSLFGTVQMSTQAIQTQKLLRDF